MGDFGIGIGIYFDTARWLSVITLVAGLISSYNIVYYAGPDYSDSQEDVEDYLLKGSTICTDTSWVPCPECDADDFSSGDAEDRFGYGVDESVKFALRNNCQGAQYEQGMTQFGIIAVMTILIIVMSEKQKVREVEFDEDEQTAQDYSVVVDGAPSDAFDPQEWKSFFEDVSDGRVTVVTIAIDNAPLLRTLIQHRILRETIARGNFEEQVKAVGWRRGKYGSKIPYTEQEMQAFVEETEPLGQSDLLLCKLGFMTDVRTHYAKLLDLKSTIRTLCLDVEYEVTDVFVTFETEAAQRKALADLSVGKIALKTQRSRGFPSYRKFRSELILQVDEPAEPSAVRWLDLATDDYTRYKGLAQSFFLTLIFITLSSTLIVWRSEAGDNASTVALYIAAMNVTVPALCKFIVNFESHPDEGNRSLSLYVKITLFRWINTAIIITVATPFLQTLSNDEEVSLLPKLSKIFFAELVTAPLVLLMDPLGHVNKHFLAPRSSQVETQDDINKLFKGTEWEIADRYTTVTKLLFLSFFYAALFPMAYYICAVSLTLTYYADKFCVMRTWMPAPKIGNEVAAVNRDYFYPACILGLMLVNAYHYACFPYDNLYETNLTVNDLNNSGNYVSTTTVTNLEGDTFRVEISQQDQVFNYVDQNMFTQAFPASSDKQPSNKYWMTSEQTDVVDGIGWTGFAIFLGFFGIKLFLLLVTYLKSFVTGSYDPSGEDKEIDFSSCEEISGYIPELKCPQFTFPLIAASNWESVDPELFEWVDGNEENYAKWDLANEIPDDVKYKLKRTKKPVLSIVRHYPVQKNYLRMIEKEMINMQLQQRAGVGSVGTTAGGNTSGSEKA